MSQPFAVAELAQAGDPTAVSLIEGLTPAWRGAWLGGPAFTCRCAPCDNLALHHALQAAPPGSVLVCDAGGRVDGGYFGELMALDACNRRIAGLVVDGSVRDLAGFERIRFPVFHRGTNPYSCAKVAVPALNTPVRLCGVEIHPGDRVFADADGVAVIPAQHWAAVAAGAVAVRRRETEIREALAAGHRLADVLGLA